MKIASTGIVALGLVFAAGCGGSSSRSNDLAEAGDAGSGDGEGTTAPQGTCGSAVEAEELATTGTPMALVADDAHVYWLDAVAAQVSRLPLAGGAAEVFVAPAAGYDLAADASAVYASSKGKLVKIDKGTKQSTELGFATTVRGISVTPGAVAWGGDPLYVLRAAANGAPTQLGASGSGGSGFRNLALDGDALWDGTHLQVARWSLVDGTSQKQTLESGFSIRTGGDFVYVASPRGIEFMAKAGGDAKKAAFPGGALDVAIEGKEVYALGSSGVFRGTVGGTTFVPIVLNPPTGALLSEHSITKGANASLALNRTHVFFTASIGDGATKVYRVARCP